MIVLEIVCWFSVFAILQSYVFYPLHLYFLSRGKKKPEKAELKEFPHIAVLLAVYNEEKVIVRKMENLSAIDYPEGKISFWIGSDCSDDETNDIIKGYVNKDPRIHFYPFENRRGKSSVINELHQNIKKKNSLSSLYLMTDASVLCPPEAVKSMLSLLQTNKLQYVDVPINPEGNKSQSITDVEKSYLNYETGIKSMESLAWHRPLGVYGGFYLLEASYFREVPSSFAVDDFYVIMNVLGEGGHGVIAPEIQCYEPHSGNILDEYKRKRRISSGNFQNLNYFRRILWRKPWSLAYSFWSHKVLRWLGPVFMLFIAISSGILMFAGNFLYALVFIGMISLLLLFPLLDMALSAVGIKLKILRSIRYFSLMNLALLAGMIQYGKGEKTNVWEPPSRE